jgi:hypothetical protein
MTHLATLSQLEISDADRALLPGGNAQRLFDFRMPATRRS